MATLLIGLAGLAILLSWGTPLQTLAVVNAVATVLINGLGGLGRRTDARQRGVAGGRVVTGGASVALLVAGWTG